MTDVDSAQFRQLLGRFATGVTIITATTPDGRPAGMTANSLASVSLVPPLVSVCVEHQADMCRVLDSAADYVINILASDQEALSRRFAGQHEGRFDGVGYRLNERGQPVLDGVLAYIECERYAAHPTGDHTIFVGRVTGGAAFERRPLLYYRGGYASLGQG
ncbi:MAG TPA: flavin reductase family protein [Gemmatimonadales bacterium]|nr:flavin reductase family protein [Gemmatimonadales bacterium]